MNISLTHDHEQFIRDQLKSGRYSSASEVIRDGLRMLVERDHLREIRTATSQGSIDAARAFVFMLQDKFLPFCGRCGGI
jgi:antitoxin ParD1/3/4